MWCSMKNDSLQKIKVSSTDSLSDQDQYTDAQVKVKLQSEWDQDDTKQVHEFQPQHEPLAQNEVGLPNKGGADQDLPYQQDDEV